MRVPVTIAGMECAITPSSGNEPVPTASAADTMVPLAAAAVFTVLSTAFLFAMLLWQRVIDRVHGTTISCDVKPCLWSHAV